MYLGIHGGSEYFSKIYMSKEEALVGEAEWFSFGSRAAEKISEESGLNIEITADTTFPEDFIYLNDFEDKTSEEISTIYSTMMQTIIDFIDKGEFARVSENGFFPYYEGYAEIREIPENAKYYIMLENMESNEEAEDIIIVEYFEKEEDYVKAMDKYKIKDGIKYRVWSNYKISPKEPIENPFAELMERAKKIFEPAI